MKRILFIGNSYTYFNDMPQIFARICKENGKDVIADSVTCGGYTLEQFLSEEDEYGARMRKMLSEGGCDYAVMQEQSVRPVTQTDIFLDSVVKLADIIRSCGAEPVLYQTWARAEGSETLTELGLSREQMQTQLRLAYEKAAAKTGAKLVYAGDRVSEAYKNGEDVICEDKSHPTQKGSEIIAAEFCREFKNIL